MLPRERPRAPARALIPPRRDAVDRTLSALALALFLAWWAVAYEAVVPPDQPVRHGSARVTALDIRGGR